MQFMIICILSNENFKAMFVPVTRSFTIIKV